MSPDIHDLQEYAASGSESAFRRIVERHSAMVRGAASRLTRSQSMAEEITQSVFILLARKARGVSGDRLSSWLHGVALGEARNAIRKESRRSRLHLNYLETMKGKSSAEASWEEVAPHLDKAVGKLSAEDRELVLLRYFEERSFPEIAVATGRSVEACKKRAQRALDRLGVLLGRRGATIGGSSLASLMASAAVLQPAPASAAAISALSVQVAASSPAFAPGFLAFLQVMTTKQTIGVTVAIVALAAIPLAVVMNRPDSSVTVGSAVQKHPVPSDDGATDKGAVSKPNARVVRGQKPKVEGSPINWAELARTKFHSRNHFVRDAAGKALAEQLKELSDDELAEALDKIKALDSDRATKHEMCALVSTELMGRDPMRVLEKLSGPEDPLLVPAVSAYEILEAKDTEKAESWLSDQKAKGNIGALDAFFEGAAVKRLLKSDPEEAVTRVMGLAEDLQADTLVAATEQNFSEAFEVAMNYHKRTGDDSLVNRLIEGTPLDIEAFQTRGDPGNGLDKLLNRVPSESVREAARQRVSSLRESGGESVPLDLLLEGEK